MMLRQALEYPGDERHSGSNGKKYPLSRCSVGIVVTVLCVTSAGATAAVGFFVVMFIAMIATAMVVTATFLLVMFTVKRIVFVLMIATAMVVAATFLLVRGRCSVIFGVMRVTMLIHNSESCDDLMLQR
jgi:hypothetical protein